MKKIGLNVMRLFSRLEKKYKDSDLIGFLLPYAREVRKVGASIKFPDFFDRVKSTVHPDFLTDTDAIAKALGSDNGYRELYLFYDYALLHVLIGLDRSPMSEELLARSVGYIKALFDIDPSELYFKTSRAEAVLSQSKYFKGCDDQTKSSVRKTVTEFSKRLSLSEEEAAKLFLTRDPFESPSAASRSYFPVLALLTVFFCIIAIWLTKSALILFFLVLPISESAKMLTDFIFSRLVRTRPIPKKKLDHVPDSAKTLTVITSLLTKKSVSDLAIKIRNCYFSNRDKNALFGLLCDLPESDTEEDANDEKIIEAIKDEIDFINKSYGIDIFVFLRSRHYAESEGKYMGWERKRGAIIELTRLLNGRDDHSLDIVCGEPSALKDVKYVVTLDSDTRLYRGAVLDMLGAMLHPSNTPVIKNGAVVKGHAILQPRMEASLPSVEKTPFAVLYAGNGGSDVYATAAYETYQSVFDEGIFCGKGILDVKIFGRLIDGAFPDGSVLSHDLIEGTRLRAGALTDISLTDDLPKSPLSCFERSHRWIRGDIQALPFAGRYVYSADGRLYKNPISPLSKFKIYDNVRRALVPISSLCALLLCIFRPDSVSPFVFSFSLSYLFLPFILSLTALIKSSNKRYFSFLIPEIASAFLMLLYSLSSLIHTSLLTTDAVFRSAYRLLFSRKKLLQWKTASESDGIKGLPLYLYTMLPSMLIGLSLLFLCPRVPLKVLGGLSAVFPVAAYFMGKPFKGEKTLSEKSKESLYAYTEDMWRFFSDNVNEKGNHLPPDNIQYAPDERVAYRTSPTNIGLYLLSCAAAYKMDVISQGEALTRIKNTITTVERLQKWNGHLYNWYDTRTLFVLGSPYVSSVDSGNFITCLVSLKNLLLKEDSTPKIADVVSRLDVIIREADFSALFDEKRKLFYIGVNTQSGIGDGHYDIFASEARTTSFYAIASGMVRREHWSRLGRIPTSSDGYLGLLSWTGTAFEYLMPSLLLPTKRGSLSYEALCFALREQKKDRTKGVWGRSESGYFHFDSDLNYQYKAFGVQSLAIKRGIRSDDVISPYSSFLALSLAPYSARRNLERLKELGAYGSYGFYEALDFTYSRVGKGYAIIKSYMSHHIGMSIVACANACLDGIFIDSFMSDPVCSSCAELIYERVPMRISAAKGSKKKKNNERPLPHVPRFVSREGKTDADSRYACMISENGLCAISMGDMLRLSALKGEVSLDPFTFGRIYRPRFLFSVDGVVHDILAGKVKHKLGDGKIGWHLDRRNLEAELSLSILGSSKTFVFSLLVQGNFKTICPMLVFIPTLCQSKERLSHPAYSDLNVCLVNDKENGALVYYRKGKSANDTDKYLAVSFESRSQNVSFASRRDILGSAYTEKDVEELITKDFDCRDGALINPFCAIKKESSANGKYVCNVLLSVGSSMTEVISSLNSARNMLKLGRRKNGAEVAEAYLKKRTAERLTSLNGDKNVRELIRLMLTLVCKRKNALPLSKTYLINDLWKHGISGDNPIVCVRITSKLTHPSPEYRFLTTLISCHKYLSLSGIRLDTVILYESGGEYFAQTKNTIFNAAEECGASFFLNRSGGIFTIDGCEERELFEGISILYVSLDEAFTLQELISSHSVITSPETVPISKVPYPEYESGEGIKVYHGEFQNNAFKLEKGKKSTDAPPFSYVYAKSHFGTLVSDSSLGYTWIGNCVERRITPFSPDNLLPMNGERLIATVKDVEYDLVACSHTVTFGHGGAIYEGSVSGVSYRITVAIDPFLPCKVVILDYLSESEGILSEYRITPIMSDIKRKNRPFDRQMLGDTEYFIPRVVNGSYDIGFLYTLREESTVCYLLGAYPVGGGRTLEHVKKKYDSINACRLTQKEYEAVISSLLPDIELSLPDRHLEVMTEYYLPYQALVCRYFGRTGFYQSGGAYGFRDQLQDCLCIMLGAPQIARTHILRCACHQYEEGDVMHWWHVIRGESRGVRTRYTDDLLWLPYVTAKYISFTGDKGILDVSLPYISSPPLLDHENDRYEKAIKSKYRTPLYYHCVRAIERSLNLGSHGLPLMGGGDWNDGMNEVGKNGGESVWLGFFLACVLDAFAPIALEFGDISGAAKYRRIRDEIKAACEGCFEDGRYLRAFFADGSPIGGSAFIDLLPQAFSVFAKSNEKRSVSGLKTAFLRLFDNENRFFALLDPPFERSEAHDPGYISSYPKGIRENGGQYTHAAIWAAMAMAECGMEGEAAFVLSKINPAAICSDKEGADRYKGEPYFLAGDVSSNEAFRGRCIWSLYTGAAGWFFNAVFNSLMGICITDDTFTLTPHLSSFFPCYHLVFKHKNTVYEIIASRGDKSSCRLDGKETANLFYFDENKHYLEITVENSDQMS